MWIAFSDDLLEPKKMRLLASPKYDWEWSKIGGAAPPIRTEHGWLTLYHGVDRQGKYSVGAMLLDIDGVEKKELEYIWQELHDYIKLKISYMGENDKLWGGSSIECWCSSENLTAFWANLNKISPGIYLQGPDRRVYTKKVFDYKMLYGYITV